MTLTPLFEQCPGPSSKNKPRHRRRAQMLQPQFSKNLPSISNMNQTSHHRQKMLMMWRHHSSISCAASHISEKVSHGRHRTVLPTQIHFGGVIVGCKVGNVERNRILQQIIDADTNDGPHSHRSSRYTINPTWLLPQLIVL
eukprot:PhF_6_TR26156/c2_g2_i2/m.37089